MHGRDYVNEEDIRDVFVDVCAHRIILNQKTRAQGISAKEVLDRMLGGVKTQFSI